MSNLQKWQHERAGLIETMRAMVELAETEGRTLTADEAKDFDEKQARAEALQADIKRERALVELEATRSAPAIRPDGAPAPKPARVENPAIGLTAEEAHRFSFVRAIRAAAAAARGERGAWAGAEFELEVSNAAAEKLGYAPRSFFVPHDVLTAERRDLTVGTPTAGGNLVETTLLAGSFIDALRARLVLAQAGMRILDGLVGDVAIPRLSAGGTAYWVAENSAPTESQQTIQQVTMTPHTAGAYTEYSRRLMLQSSLGVESFVRDDLAAVIARAIEYAGLHGDSGVNANQPDGVEATAGIGSVAVGANGGAPTWPHIVELESDVAAGSADMGALAYITNPKVRGKLKTVDKASGAAQFVWGDGPAPVNGYPAFVTTNVRSDRSKGSGTNLSSMFFGNWNDLLMGIWGGLDVLVDPYSNSTTGATRVVVFQDVDFGLRHPASFSAALDFDTT